MRTSERALRHRSGDLRPAERQTLARLVAGARFELIPLANALEQAEALPPGAPVSVTASPSPVSRCTVMPGQRWSMRSMSSWNTSGGQRKAGMPCVM